MNCSTSRSSEVGSTQYTVGRKGIKAIGKKICKLKKLTLYKETKQNYNNLKQKLNKKGKGKKRSPEANSGPSTCRAVPLPLHHMLIISQRNGKKGLGENQSNVPSCIFLYL